jgi:hypothetical protein
LETSLAWGSFARGGKRLGQFGGKYSQVLVSAATDANASIEGRNTRHTHKHIARNEFVHHAFCEGAVASAINGHKICR